MNFIKDFLKYFQEFGFTTALRLIFIPRIYPRVNKRKNWYHLYINALENWLHKNFIEIINRYKVIEEREQNNKNSVPERIIWTMWWQGKEQMPEVITLCHESLVKNANGNKIILITQYNISSYVEIPKIIYDKVEENKISFTHLSDIVRLMVLVKYGGLWIDSAIFVTKPISIGNVFFSTNLGLNSESYYYSRWCIGILSAPPNYIPLKFVLECLLKYWNHYNVAIDYLMFDAIMLLAYNTLFYFKRDIDNLQINSPNLHSSRYQFDKEAEISEFKQWISQNQFLSLTWRIKYPDKIGEKMTYYGLLKQYLEKLDNKS